MYVYIHKQNGCNIYAINEWKPYALPVITTWQLMHLGTWATGHVNPVHQYITVHHVAKCISCYKAIVVITGRWNSFRDCIYVMLILLLWDSSTLCVVDHLWPLTYKSIYFNFYRNFINKASEKKRIICEFKEIMFLFLTYIYVWHSYTYIFFIYLYFFTFIYLCI